MIDVADGADIDVRLATVKFFFRHREYLVEMERKKVEPLTGVEPVTSSLPRTRSTN